MTTNPDASTSRTPVRYLPTTEAYDRWSSVYDTDGNFLQALDDKELKTLFPRFMSLVFTTLEPNKPKGQPWTLIDLGCGTGRNTAHLVDAALSRRESERSSSSNQSYRFAHIFALDSSKGMLEVARKRLAPFINEIIPDPDQTLILNLSPYDLLLPPISSSTQGNTEQVAAAPSSVVADAIISTLVLEHVPIPLFFRHVSSLLRDGGFLLLTNMHARMGQISQAGFVDVVEGGGGREKEKIRPADSYAHEVRDVVEVAREWGLDLVVDDEEEGEGEGEGERGGTEKVKGMREVAVAEEMVEELGMRSRKWVGVSCWFGGIFRKRERDLVVG